jgi:hypothetical protein
LFEMRSMMSATTGTTPCLPSTVFISAM